MNEVRISLHPISDEKTISALDEKVRRWANRKKFGVSWRCYRNAVEVEYHGGTKAQWENSTKSLEMIVNRAKAAFTKGMPLHPSLQHVFDSAMSVIPSPAPVSLTERLQRALASVERARHLLPSPLKRDWAPILAEINNASRHIAETIHSL